MGTFTPIGMKCTQEQFEAIKPKLKGIEINTVTCFNTYPYLINFYENKLSNIDIHGKLFVSEFKNAKKVYETWNEEIFLKACGIEVESLEQQLQKAEAEVKRLQSLIEENKPKVGDWVINTQSATIFKNNTVNLGINDKWNKYKKITNPELIKLLENEIK